MAPFKSSNARLWMILAAIFFITTIILLIALIAVVAKDGDGGAGVCGEGSNPNENTIDLSEPDKPDVFHDLTEDELIQLRSFLEQDPNIRATKPGKASLNSSYIFTADLFLPPKADVLAYLDKKSGAQPERRARVMMFRGDLPTPVVEEYICGPLPTVTSCELMQLEGRRNPAQFSLRPFNDMEFGVAFGKLLGRAQKELGYILRESYQTTLFDCADDGVCLSFIPSPMGTSLIGGVERRRMWLSFFYKLEFKTLHPVDFAVLLNLDGQDSSEWDIDKIWYGGRIYDSLDDLIVGYNSSSIPVTRLTKPVNGPQLYSSLTLKGDPVPKNSQRPPRMVEPDGKRYSVKHRKVEYLNWSFHFRMSSFSGPAIYDVRFKGERIVYELSLQEIAVFYSSHSPHPQTTNYIDSGALLGTNSKSLLLGSDCPETATYIPTKIPAINDERLSLKQQLKHETSQCENEISIEDIRRSILAEKKRLRIVIAQEDLFTEHIRTIIKFMAQSHVKVAKFTRGVCLFEQNDGTPLRRKLAYTQFVGGFYGGMSNSALVVRSIITVGNYDYVVDYVFHQTGAIQAKVMSTGYIQSVYYADYEKNYALRIQDSVGGSLHHHMIHFKADLDISGTSNRYETIDISKEDVTLTTFPSTPFQMNKFSMSQKQTELDAVYKYNFDTPKYHVVHNHAQRTRFNEIKAYRLAMNGMSKQLLDEGKNNEKSIPWARNQLVVTKHKDHEFWSTSSYAMWDSADPVVDFSQFYKDNDNITDEDLVLWITMGTHHLPHAEDIPVTTTVGSTVNFLLLPYNYFPECPSVSSRDAMRVNLKDPKDSTKGVVLTRYHDTESRCAFPASGLEEELDEDPDSMLESKQPSTVF